MELYRYSPLGSCKNVKRFVKFIAQQQVYFSSPREFNDPFDKPLIALDGSDSEINSIINPVVKGLRRSDGRLLSPSQRISATQRLKRRHRSSEFRKTLNDRILDDYCALCLSQDNNIPTMWSHYADNHKGVCVGFKLDQLKLNFDHFFRINYLDKRPDVSIFDASQPLKILKAYSTKGTHWSYEKEVRVVNMHGAKLVPFNKNLIGSIYLGSEISASEKDLIITLVKKYMSDVPILLSKRNEESLSIDFEEITS